MKRNDGFKVTVRRYRCLDCGKIHSLCEIIEEGVVNGFCLESSYCPVCGQLRLWSGNQIDSGRCLTCHTDIGDTDRSREVSKVCPECHSSNSEYAGEDIRHVEELDYDRISTTAGWDIKPSGHFTRWRKLFNPRKISG